MNKKKKEKKTRKKKNGEKKERKKEKRKRSRFVVDFRRKAHGSKQQINADKLAKKEGKER